jgi:hypothetical protein
VTYTAAEGRQQLLDALASATDSLALALHRLGEAYERLDDDTADRLEAELFRPVQLAYGRAQRIHTAFAERHSLPTRNFDEARGAAPSQPLKGLIEDAVAAITHADGGLAALQDSLLPIEVGDAELRSGLEDVRRTIGTLHSRARELLRTLGR